MMLRWNGQRLPVYSIEATGIADLELSPQHMPYRQNNLPNNNPVTYHTPDIPNTPRATAQQTSNAIMSDSVTTNHNKTESFVDPAILSFSKPSKPSLSLNSTAPTVRTTNASYATSSSPVMIGDSTVASTSRTTQTTSVSTPRATFIDENSTSGATLSGPFSTLGLNSTDGLADLNDPIADYAVPEGRKDAAPLTAPLKYTGKRSRRGGRGKLQKEPDQQFIGSSQFADTSYAATPPNKQNSGKGWRQTAFVEPASPSPKNVLGKKAKAKAKKNIPYAEDPNGWATEDATDIQEMGDFDFQSNLSKFDKRRVFDEIRNDDTIPGEERLVGLNKRPRPGTNGGKNLHPTENVLDDGPPKWNNEAWETDEDESEDFSSGRNSGRARSRGSIHAQASRKGSTKGSSVPIPAPISVLNRGHLSSSRTVSPQSHKQPPISASPVTSSAQTGSFRLASTNRQCPCISPLQMLEIEQLAIGEFGLTEEMVTENAGRGVAEAVVSESADLMASSRILVFAGNHRTGSRAVSAARHLRNRGYRVTLCILGMDREDEFIDTFRKQVEVFKNASGRVIRWQDLSVKLASPDYMPDFVVDALFGIHIAFEDLRTDDQASAFEIMSWINRSNIEIMSVDIPSGLSASSGAFNPFCSFYFLIFLALKHWVLLTLDLSQEKKALFRGHKPPSIQGLFYVWEHQRRVCSVL